VLYYLHSFFICNTDYTRPDLIIVLKDGAVYEQGTHEELMRKEGLYHSMWIQQHDTEEVGTPAVEEV
jgi:ABC-type transport system involved in cytochrome bd biosynthesis fused ATPase/permease subunit